MKGISPKYCFVCGSALEELSLGWLQCKSKSCGEVFMPFVDSNGNQNLMLQNTPITPSENNSETRLKNHIVYAESKTEGIDVVISFWDRAEAKSFVKKTGQIDLKILTKAIFLKKIKQYRRLDLF